MLLHATGCTHAVQHTHTHGLTDSDFALPIGKIVSHVMLPKKGRQLLLTFSYNFNFIFGQVFQNSHVQLQVYWLRSRSRQVDRKKETDIDRYLWQSNPISQIAHVVGTNGTKRHRAAQEQQICQTIVIPAQTTRPTHPSLIRNSNVTTCAARFEGGAANDSLCQPKWVAVDTRIWIVCTRIYSRSFTLRVGHAERK